MGPKEIKQKADQAFDSAQKTLAELNRILKTNIRLDERIKENKNFKIVVDVELEAVDTALDKIETSVKQKKLSSTELKNIQELVKQISANNAQLKELQEEANKEILKQKSPENLHKEFTSTKIDIADLMGSRLDKFNEVIARSKKDELEAAKLALANMRRPPGIGKEKSIAEQKIELIETALKNNTYMVSKTEPVKPAPKMDAPPPLPRGPMQGSPTKKDAPPPPPRRSMQSSPTPKVDVPPPLPRRQPEQVKQAPKMDAPPPPPRRPAQLKQAPKMNVSPPEPVKVSPTSASMGHQLDISELMGSKLDKFNEVIARSKKEELEAAKLALANMPRPPGIGKEKSIAEQKVEKIETALKNNTYAIPKQANQSFAKQFGTFAHKPPDKKLPLTPPQMQKGPKK